MLTTLSSKPVTAVANGLAILTPIFAVISWLIPDWFGQLTVAKALLVGLALAFAALLATAILLALLAWAYRKFRPLDSPSEPSAQPALKYDDKHLRDEMARVISTHKQIISDYQRMCGLEARFTDALDGFKEATAKEHESLRMYCQVLEGKITELGKLNNKNLDYAREQLGSLYNALAAVYDRERLQRLRGELEASTPELCAPTTNGATYTEEEWEDWQKTYVLWEARLDEWTGLAECYYPAIRRLVFTVSDANLKQDGVAKDHQFPGSPAIIDYKAFWAKLKNWRNWRQEAENAVHQVAFNGGTAKERPVSLFTHFPERPDEERN